jgi:hypothetical protein
MKATSGVADCLAAPLKASSVGIIANSSMVTPKEVKQPKVVIGL